MHDEIVKALFDVYPREDKSDFYPTFIYLKYLQNFVFHALQVSGLPAEEPKEKLPQDVDGMLKLYVQQIGENAVSADTDIYHGKVLTLQDAVKLITQKEDVKLSLPERVIPYKIAREVVVRSNDTIVLGTCVCRSLSPKPCLPPPQEVCLYVGDPFASFLAEENPMFRKVSHEEAVKVLEFAHKKGFVQAAYFKKETANRFVALCNCCGCCCPGIRMWNLLAGTVPIMAASGYVAEVNDDCNACAVCADSTCSFGAIGMDENNQKAVIDLAKCMGCGVCVDVCPSKAIQLRREPSKGDPLDLDELKNLSAAT